ncbi:MAG: hypothetical protein IPM03_02340 [Sulfuritalea sp.]|nr:hypothetical protein [Sulfuritalea sp.]
MKNYYKAAIDILSQTKTEEQRFKPCAAGRKQTWYGVAVRRPADRKKL